MSIPLEDTFADILGKAQRGLEISDTELSEKSGVSLADLKLLRAGNFDETAAHKIAPLLDLNADALAAIALQRWQPQHVEVAGLFSTTTPFDDMTVNAYLVWDSGSREAAAFDTGADCNGLLRFIGDNRLALKFILCTHTHGDHILELDLLHEKTGAPAFASRHEPLDGAEPFDEGKTFALGSLRIDTRLTCGHSRGGITYVVSGLAKPVAIVGDALFAGSMGGGMVSYADALRTNREQIFSLPDETILCPGHGPLTTVGEEKKHNPFFS